MSAGTTPHRVKKKAIVNAGLHRPQWRIKVMSAMSVGVFSSGLPHRAFSLWTWEESSTSCLSAVPWCLEKAHGLFNSQPIFCPSHHFIPALELSSGPHTVTFLTYLAAYTSTIPENIVSSSPPSSLSIWTTNHISKPHVGRELPAYIWLFWAVCVSAFVWWGWNHTVGRIK